MWLALALLSASLIALSSIFAKIGLEGVDSNLATAISNTVILLLAWGLVLVTNAQSGIASLTQKNWLFLILSGLATGASWLVYYKAIQIGDVSRVVPVDKLSAVIALVMAAVFLGEQTSARSVVGAILITLGTLVMVL